MKPQPGRYASGTVRHRKLPAGSVNVFSIRILSGGYVRWLPNVEPVWHERPPLVEQQTLHREVEAYEARLARCRHALEKIENRLARLTR